MARVGRVTIDLPQMLTVLTSTVGKSRHVCNGFDLVTHPNNLRDAVHGDGAEMPRHFPEQA